MAYLVATVAGIVTTQSLIPIARAERGYDAIGGEWLIAPLFIIIVVMVQSFMSLLEEVGRYEPDEN